MKKRKILVLSTGFTLILITCIIIVISFIDTATIEELDPIDRRLIVPFYILLGFPIVLEELLLMRSVYKLTILRPLKSAKICCIISMFILLAVLVFQGLFFAGIITEDILPDGPTAKSSRIIELLLLTEWPVVLLAGILTSVNSGEEAP